MKHLSGMRNLLWSILALFVAACASIGRPEGGPRDEDPPAFVSSNPKPGATNVNRTQITINFDENIQLEDAFSKVVVSPAQKTQPKVSSNGKHVTVDLQDSLLPNTTYTIDFADAIKDLNEGNILDGFALDFATGDTIDSLRISGMVLQAENLEPAQGMLVGVYSNLSDTALSTIPLQRIARTNQLGQFTIRNLPAGVYRVVAINDLNRDYHWDRSEDVAFYPYTVSPSTEEITVTDTLFAADRSDSLIQRQGIRYLPNDVLLTWFNVGYKAQYLLDYKRDDRRRFTINFAAPSDSLPEITIVDGAPGQGRNANEWTRLKHNASRDSLEYWFTDTTVMNSDSLRLSIKYLKTDSTDALAWTTDTLKFFYRNPDAKKKKKDNKKETAPQFTVDTISGDTTFLPPADQEYLQLSILSGSSQDLNRPLILNSNLPIDTIYPNAVKFEIKRDTLWYPINIKFIPDSSNLLTRRRVDITWEEGAKYRLSIDTLGVKSIYDIPNRPFTQEINTKELSEYSNLIFTIVGADTIQSIIELLNNSDSPVYRAIKPAGTNKLTFNYLTPGTYYARLILDANANGRWDTGNPVDSIQPEEVYYFAKRLTLKKNWDVEQTWDIYELPIDVQKPYSIKKNKPKLKRGEQAPVEEDEFGDEDEQYDPFGSSSSSSSKSSSSSRRASGISKASSAKHL